MADFRRLALILAALSSATPVAAQPADGPALAALTEGTRIRASGPAVRDAIGPSVGEVLRRGLMSLVVRPPAEGLVVEATPLTLRFAADRGGSPIELPWTGIDRVDVYRGRSVPLGTLQGAGAGALTGLAMWGVIELIFLAADNPVVDEPEVVLGIATAAGALLGAATLGDRWERVHPTGTAR